MIKWFFVLWLMLKERKDELGLNSQECREKVSLSYCSFRASFVGG